MGQLAEAKQNTSIGRHVRMAGAYTLIDRNNDPGLRAIAEEMEASGHDIVPRRDNEEVARLTPVRSKRWKISDEDLEAVRSSVGGWKGLIDEGEFLADNYASHDISIPRPVDGWRCRA